MSGSPTLDQLRIMVVDDNVDAADSLGVLLRLRGATVEVVHDGTAALDRVAEFKPMVMLLDLGMPGVDGFDVAEQIRSQPQYADLVLVAQTGWGNEEMRRRSQAAGFNHHLVKPANFEALVTLVAGARPSQTSSAGGTSAAPT